MKVACAIIANKYITRLDGKIQNGTEETSFWHARIYNF